MVVTTKELLKTVLKYDGNENQAAKALGVKQQSVNDRIKRNPDLKKAILNVREEALKKAGITRALVYGTLKAGLKSNIVVVANGKAKSSNVPDRHERREHAKLCVQLLRDLEPDKEQSVENISTVIFNIISNDKRQVIDVA